MPNNGNAGADYDVTFASGTLTQDIVAGVTINQLFMSGGTLVLANPLTLNYGLQVQRRLDHLGHSQHRR